jgi:hypothetical protein
VRRHVLRVGPAALFIVLAASACSSTGSTQTGSTRTGQVATLETAAAQTISPSPSTKQVRERIDMTSAEKETLQKPYLKCMKQHGVDVLGRRAGQEGPDPKSDQANTACESLLPLPAWELDPANPEAREFARGVRDCLKGKGVRYVEISEDGAGVSLGGQDNDAQSIKLGMQYGPECEREVAAR